MSEDQAILFANEAFYSAFSSCDVMAMDAVWAIKAPLICVHPGGAPITGRAAIMASWTDILNHQASGGMRFDGAKAVTIDDVAFVTCFERLGEGALSATNAFVREGRRWRMVLHHAGACVEAPEPPRVATSEPGALH